MLNEYKYPKHDVPFTDSEDETNTVEELELLTTHINSKNCPYQADLKATLRSVIKQSWVDFCLDYFNESGKTPSLFVTLLTKTTNEDYAREAYKHFVNQLRARLYGRNGLTDADKQPAIFAVMERHYHNDYLHFHIIVGYNPQSDSCKAKSLNGLAKMIRGAWSKIKLRQTSTFDNKQSIQEIDPSPQSLKRLVSYMVKNVNDGGLGEVLIERM